MKSLPRISTQKGSATQLRDWATGKAGKLVRSHQIDTWVGC